MVKIVIPVDQFDGKDSRIFPHFGRAPLFTLITLTADHQVEDIKPITGGPIEGHFGGHGAAESLALNLQVDAVIVKGMGRRGLQIFQEKKVSVFTGDINTVGEAIDAYFQGTLTQLTEPCKDAQHQ